MDECMKLNIKRCSIPGQCIVIDTLTNGQKFSLQMPIKRAEFIVLACNSHKDLVTMLRDIAKRITDSDEWWLDDPNKGGFDLEAIEALIVKLRS